MRMSRRGLLQASLLGAACWRAVRRRPTDRPSSRPAARADPRADRPASSTSPSACGRSVPPGRAWTPSAWATRWSCTITATAAAAGRSPGARAPGRCAWPCRPVPREVAVIGCGVLGLTSAILAQRAGARVTIYAREQLPLTTSARATGEWTPDSRIALANAAAPDFAAVWEEMARTAFKSAPRLSRPAGHAGGMDRPVFGFRRHAAHRPGQQPPAARARPPAVDFASYSRRIADLTPKWRPGAGRRHAVQGGVCRAQRDHDLQHRRLRPHPAERLLHRRRPVPAGRVPGARRRSPPWARRWSSTARATARGRCGRTRRSCPCAARSRG